MDKEMAEAVFSQAFTLWFNPEIERRRASGKLPEDFVLWAAQVVMEVDGRENIIRFNEEVRGAYTAIAARATNAGEPVSLTTQSDLKDVVGVSLADDDANSGHLTILMRGAGWFLSFDFRYNSARIQQQLSIADQFLDAARFSVEANLPAPAVDNLFDAVQIMAKCFLLLSPDKGVLDIKTHKGIDTRFNQQKKLGNVSEIATHTVNRLSDLRPKVRYALEPVTISIDELTELLKGATSMRAEIEERRPKRDSGR